MCALLNAFSLQLFWDDLFAKAKSWGLVTYEQDWLDYQIELIQPVQSDLFLGERWLKQMGLAADRHQLTLQYCMALPRHVLAALEIPAVTHVNSISVVLFFWNQRTWIDNNNLEWQRRPKIRTQLKPRVVPMSRDHSAADCLKGAVL